MDPEIRRVKYILAMVVIFMATAVVIDALTKSLTFPLLLLICVHLWIIAIIATFMLFIRSVRK